MNLLTALAILGMFVSLGLGSLMPKLIQKLWRLGTIKYVIVDPSTKETLDKYARPKQGKCDFKKWGISVPTIGDRNYLNGSRRTIFVNQVTGDPYLFDDCLSAVGIDGRSWFKMHYDERVNQVKRGPGGNLEAMLKYAVIGVVIVGIMVLIALAILGTMLQRGGAPA